ncbi:NHLP leader peptide family RiPP precursor [Cylindrospermum sp. FACHB-282]|uniref:NHLP leader peptide family RiPP precursor n=1 Tax=Cylindrospermum sp. FACHB-282 TaxID=2692794 RepID=UPI001681CE4D|nr:NHLP leader peptide family RiPP precursor [Cylindrospermum sp. FACHB-282]MBD2387100.1 NHLP leader peptide family natural product precursor [Cylindrospermum sp. FACHB-282]
MSEQTPEINQENLEAKIIARAWKSEEYKQELLNNPKAVIEREFNIQIPEGVTVQILEETPTNLYFVMPIRPQIDDRNLAEISDEELASIAGGNIYNAIINGVSLVAKYSVGRYTATGLSAYSISYGIGSGGK